MQTSSIIFQLLYSGAELLERRMSHMLYAYDGGSMLVPSCQLPRGCKAYLLLQGLDLGIFGLQGILQLLDLHHYHL